MVAIHAIRVGRGSYSFRLCLHVALRVCFHLQIVYILDRINVLYVCKLSVILYFFDISPPKKVFIIYIRNVCTGFGSMQYNVDFIVFVLVFFFV